MRGGPTVRWGGVDGWGGGGVMVTTPVTHPYRSPTNPRTGIQNLFDNLQKKVGKATVQTLCDSLADAGQIKRKEFGKAKVRSRSPWASPHPPTQSHTAQNQEHTQSSPPQPNPYSPSLPPSTHPSPHQHTHTP